MKEKLKSFFTKNIALKIVSLIIGFLIWAVIANFQDPTMTTPLTIPVTYTNADLLLSGDSLVMLSGPGTVQINVTTQTSQQTKLKASMFSCTADLTDHTGGDLANQRVHIRVEQTGGEDIILDWSYLRNDPNITVAMDRYITKEFTVQSLPTDSLEEGLILGSTLTFEPASITVSGPESRFTNLASVKAVVSLSALTDGNGGVFTEPVTLDLYDANNQIISNTDGWFTMSQKDALLTAVVSRMKSVAVKSVGTVGTVAEGYRYVSSAITPESVNVYGLKGTVADVTEVLIPAEAIDISGLSEDKTFTVSISNYLPEGVKLVDPSAAEVSVEVFIEPLITETYTVTEDLIRIENADPAMRYEIEKVSHEIRVTGLEEDVNVFEVTDLDPSIDVTGLEEGTHEVPLKFTKRAGYTYEGLEELTVSVTVEPAPEEETTEEATEEATEDESAGAGN